MHDDSLVFTAVFGWFLVVFGGVAVFIFVL